MINRFIILLISFLSTNINAQTVEQYFIKIAPKQELVNCGRLINKKHKTVLDYYVKDDKLDIFEPSKALEWINDSIQSKNNKEGKVLFFIHGYWASLPFALNRTSQVFNKSYFKSDSSNVVAVVHLIWDANDIYYKQCIKNLEASTNTLASIFNTIESSLDFEHSLLCHSMGNRFLHKTISTQSIKVHFEELILMAPDLDYRKFQEQPSLFSSIASNTTVFFHQKDKTLKISKTINKIERLGRLDKSDISNTVQFIDCSSLKDIDSLSDSVMRHLYFLTSKTVQQQVESILENKKNEAK